MGVTDVIVTVFYNVLNGLFLTDNNYYVIMADLIAKVADVIVIVIVFFKKYIRPQHAFYDMNFIHQSPNCNSGVHIQAHAYLEMEEFHCKKFSKR